MDIGIASGTPEDLDALRPLWPAMLEHHRHLGGAQWPVRGAARGIFWTLGRT
ncbi:hypothetical protein [Actinomadura luteofluorescens]|uniref:hypothetical protein n=1 Tax=Actinomadura luteofluorescens TaxID=46163 RepID=UPI003D8B8CDF